MSKPDKLSQPAAEWVDIDSLTAWDKNPRRNDDAAKEVAKSIQRFGFGAPILARRSDGVVIAGHTRLKAAALLGLDKVPVRYLDLDPAEARALALADNKLGELADWDAEMLGEVLRDLEAEGTSLDGLGFTDDELKTLMADPVVEPSENDDDAPEVDEHGEPDSVLGGVYELGPHRLVCGDSTTAEAWDALLGSERPGAIWTDPPYGMALDPRYDSMHSSNDHRVTGDRFSPIIGDDEPFNAAPFLSAFDDVQEQFWFGADYYRGTINTGGSWVVWDKRSNDSGMDLDAVLGAQFELCWSRQKHRREIARILWSGHHGMQSDDMRKREHPTQKPASLIVWFLGRWVPDGAVVFDPFGGSGSTLIACAQTGRVARLIELDPRYCDVIRRRYTRWAREHGRDPGPGALDG